MLVVEPLLTYRFGRVQESPRKALSKGVRITVGYSLLLLLLAVAVDLVIHAGLLRVIALTRLRAVLAIGVMIQILFVVIHKSNLLGSGSLNGFRWDFLNFDCSVRPES